jgi:ElaB/YqjD/DUF883 family membrane-anchored ribosome-binding protein
MKTTYDLANTSEAYWIQGPLGPFLGGGPVSSRHLGMSYDQWVSLVAHRRKQNAYLRGTAERITEARFPAYDSNYLPHPERLALRGWEGEYGDYGDACARKKRRYDRLRAKIRRKRKKFKRRGRRFMWIRTGTGRKWIRNKKNKLEKIRSRAASKGCYWASKAKRAHKKKMRAAARKETALEAKIATEHAESQAQLEEATKEVVAAAESSPQVNPLLIVGIVAGAGILMVAMAKKGKK